MIRSLVDLENEIILCRKCPRLVEWREKVGYEKRLSYKHETYWAKPVPGFGDENARVLVLGLAPGAHGSNRTGRMFTGDDSGRFLFAALHRAGFANQPTATSLDDGLKVQELFISALCRCVPPGNKPLPDEVKNCSSYLMAEMRLLPNLVGIVALGKMAYDDSMRILRSKVAVSNSPGFGHGVFFSIDKSVPWLLASYHPSRQNTQTGRLTPVMFDRIWEDVRKLLIG